MAEQIEDTPTSIDKHSPSTTSDASQPSFLDTHDILPADGPPKHAHIIDLATTSTSTLKQAQWPIHLQDAIATTLFTTSPTILRLFLHPTVHTFKAIFGKKDIQLVIWRKGLEVLVGTFEHHTSLKRFRFEHVAGFLIGYDGTWHLKVTAGDAYAAPRWPEVWAGRFESYGGLAKMVVEGEGQQEGMERRAARLAGEMMAAKFWEMKADVKTA